MEKFDIVKHSYDVTNEMFKIVKDHYPEIWKKISDIIRPFSVDSIKRIFQQHLMDLEDISVFQDIERIPMFLLDFVHVILRSILHPGTPYGILLTCFITKFETQKSLDGYIENKYSNNNIPKSLLRELHLYKDSTHIFEISRNKTFFYILVQNYTETELLKLLPDCCFLNINNDNCNKGYNQYGQKIYFNLAKFVIIESSKPGIYHILYKSRTLLVVLLNNISLKNIIAFSDIMHIYNKCGISSYFFNFINILEIQFFQNIKQLSSYDLNTINIIKYQCFSGAPLPLNRNGLRKDSNKSGLERVCFEAARQNLIEESIHNKSYPVKDTISKLFFGQQFNEGTGYKFAVIINE